MKVEVFTIPGGYDSEHGYCAQVVLLYDYENAIDVLKYLYEQADIAARSQECEAPEINEALRQANDLLRKVGA